MSDAEMSPAGWRTGVALTTALLAAACAALAPEPVPGPVLHVLEANPAVALAPGSGERVLEVTALRAWPGFDTPRMAYVLKRYELDYYAASQWADTPARMIGPLLAGALERTGAFGAVVRSPSAVPGDLRLQAEVVRLAHSFTTRPSRVELALRVELVDAREKRVLAARLIEETEPAPSEDAYGGVRAANAALERALARIVELAVTGAGRR